MISKRDYAGHLDDKDRKSVLRDLRALQAKEATGQLDAAFVSLLDANDPNWRRTLRQRRWWLFVSEVEEWVLGHGKWPRKGSSDSEEADLGAWLGTQRQSASEEKRRILDERIPGWNSQNPEQVWMRNFQAAAEWFAVHPGKYPRVKSGDPVERKVRMWLDNQKAKVTTERREYLDIQLPEWAGHTQQERWQAGLDRLTLWVEQNGGALPPRSINPEGHWIAVARHKTQPPHRRALLDAAVSNWEGAENLNERWSLSMDALASWILAHDGKFPPRTVKPEGSWLFVQRYDKSVTDERRAMLDAALPGWRIPPR